ncbi:hypothetical protein P7K49_018155, partial [Saguinus oedipus]
KTVNPITMSLSSRALNVSITHHDMSFFQQARMDGLVYMRHTQQPQPALQGIPIPVVVK